MNSFRKTLFIFAALIVCATSVAWCAQPEPLYTFTADVDFDGKPDKIVVFPGKEVDNEIGCYSSRNGGRLLWLHYPQGDTFHLGSLTGGAEGNPPPLRDNIFVYDLDRNGKNYILTRGFPGGESYLFSVIQYRSGRFVLVRQIESYNRPTFDESKAILRVDWDRHETYCVWKPGAGFVIPGSPSETTSRDGFGIFFAKFKLAVLNRDVLTLKSMLTADVQHTVGREPPGPDSLISFINREDLWDTLRHILEQGYQVIGPRHEYYKCPKGQERGYGGYYATFRREKGHWKCDSFMQMGY